MRFYLVINHIHIVLSAKYSEEFINKATINAIQT